ncbi:MAG: hypothetical protein ACR2NP_15670 [Pirellulaceae bacterium]
MTLPCRAIILTTENRSKTVMQRGLISTALIACVLCGTPATQGQQAEILPEPDEVLDAFYEALGGEMALSGLSEIHVRGSYGGSSSGSIEAKYKDGKLLLEYEVDGFGKLRMGFDGTTYWRSIPGQPAIELDGEDLAMARNFTLLPPQFLNWRSFEGTTEVIEGTDFRGRAVWHLRFSGDDKIEIDRYFDRDNGLLVAVDLKSTHADTTTLYEFEEYEGVLWPHNITTESMIDDLTAVATTEVRITEIDFDAELDDDDFAMPDDDSDDEDQ